MEKYWKVTSKILIVLLMVFVSVVIVLNTEDKSQESTNYYDIEGCFIYQVYYQSVCGLDEENNTCYDKVWDNCEEELGI